MADEIQFDAGPQLSGATVYALLRNSTGLVYDFVGLSFVAYATADYARYDLALTEQGTASGYYVGDMPAVTAGVYSVTVKEQAGGSPAETDVRIGDGEIEWDGTAVPTPGGAAFAAAWGARDLGDGRTADLYLQGLTNRIEFAANGLSYTVYSTDDTTPIATGVATRLAANVGGLRSVNPA